jgi:hypothetical protein
MGILPLLMSLIFPACGSPGIAGLPVPALIDFTTLQRPATPNTALAAPAGFKPPPDTVTHRYDVPPDTLYAAINAVAVAEPRTFPQVHYDPERQAHYVVRSALWNFPDLVAVQVNPDSTLIIWSRSVYGESDLGVNKKRIDEWLANIDARVHAP